MAEPLPTPSRNDAAAFWGIASNGAFNDTERLTCALRALDYYGGIAEQAEEEAERRSQVPPELASMPAQDRARWLAAEVVYEAAISYHPGEERTMTPFRDLRPEAQAAVMTYMLDVMQVAHSVGLNPLARADAEEVADRG